MSVIYRNVEVLEGIEAQRRNAPNPQVAAQLQEQYNTVQKQVNRDINPLIKLCNSWTYVPPTAIS